MFALSTIGLVLAIFAALGTAAILAGLVAWWIGGE